MKAPASSAHTSIAEAPTAAPLPALPTLADQASHVPLTRVALAYLESRYKLYLRFGEAKQALQARGEFLEEQGLAQRRGQRLILARNLLATLRGRELAQAAQAIAADTGLEHRPVADGQRVAGIYRRSVMLASGRYAMLDDGMGFSLVPWKPVIEHKLGQQLTATLRGGGASWDIGRPRGPSLS